MSFQDDLAQEIEQAPVKPMLTLVPDALPMPPHFERCKEWIEASLEEGSFTTAEDVRVALAENRAQIWPGSRSVIVTEINAYPNQKVVRVWVAGGDMDEIVAMAPGIEAWARLQGCSSVVVEGRKGWEKVLKSFGYEPFLYSARKVL